VQAPPQRSVTSRASVSLQVPAYAAYWKIAALTPLGQMGTCGVTCKNVSCRFPDATHGTTMCVYHWLVHPTRYEQVSSQLLCLRRPERHWSKHQSHRRWAVVTVSIDSLFGSVIVIAIIDHIPRKKILAWSFLLLAAFLLITGGLFMALGIALLLSYSTHFVRPFST
jgi:hypothetical protein